MKNNKPFNKEKHQGYLKQLNEKIREKGYRMDHIAKLSNLHPSYLSKVLNGTRIPKRKFKDIFTRIEKAIKK